MGIIIKMYFDEHNPPHFHAYYDDYAISVNIETLAIDGKFPPRSRRAVLEWAEMHRAELMHNWHALRSEGEIKKIEPLE